MRISGTALFLAREGRHQEALSEIERAVSLDPLAPGIRIAAANVKMAAGRHEASRQEAVRALALQPGLLRVRELQALADLLLGEFERCIALDSDRIPEPAPCAPIPWEGSARRNRPPTLSARPLRPKRPGSDFSPVSAARALARDYAWTTNAEQSLVWLERAYDISPEGEDLVTSGRCTPRSATTRTSRPGCSASKLRYTGGSSAKGLGHPVSEPRALPRPRPRRGSDRAPALESLWYLRGEESIQAFLSHADQISIVSPQVFVMDSNGIITGSVDPRVVATAREQRGQADSPGDEPRV